GLRSGGPGPDHVRPDARASRGGQESHRPARRESTDADGAAGPATGRGDLPGSARGGALPPARWPAGMGGRPGQGTGRPREAERTDGRGAAQARRWIIERRLLKLAASRAESLNACGVAVRPGAAGLASMKQEPGTPYGGVSGTAAPYSWKCHERSGLDA